MEEDKKEEPKKSVLERTSIIIASSLSVLLIGGAITAALLVPKTTTSVDIIEQQYAFSENTDDTPDDGFGHVDWYSFYDTNAISQESIKIDELASYPEIHGLKDSEVESRVNATIREHALSFHGQYPGVSVKTNISANLFNVFSVYWNTSSSASHLHALSIDLRTGEEIRFNDIFTSRANKSSVVYDAFIRKIQVDLTHELRVGACNIGNKIQLMETNPETATQAMCFDGTETLDGLIARRASLEYQLAHAEDTAFSLTQQYLAQDSPEFYLTSAGPVFIFKNTSYSEEAKNIMSQLAYYERYRTADSIYADDSLSIRDMYLSDYIPSIVSSDGSNHPYHEIDFQENIWREYSVYDSRVKYSQVLDYINQHYPHDNSDNTKMEFTWYDIMPRQSGPFVSFSITINDYLMDKAFFESTFKEMLFDSMSMYGDALARRYSSLTGLYDEDNPNYRYTPTETVVVVAKDGAVYENSEDLFDPMTDYIGYLKDIFKNHSYHKYDSQGVATYVYLSQLTDTDLTSYSLSMKYNAFGDITLTLTSPDGQIYGCDMSLSDISSDYLKPSLR